MTECAGCACKAVTIGDLSCKLNLTILFVIVSPFACTFLRAQSSAESNACEVGGPDESSSTNKSAAQYELWNISAAKNKASEESGTSWTNGDQNSWIHSWLRAVDTARASQPHSTAELLVW